MVQEGLERGMRRKGRASHRARERWSKSCERWSVSRTERVEAERVWRSVEAPAPVPSLPVPVPVALPPGPACIARTHVEAARVCNTRALLPSHGRSYALMPTSLATVLTP